MNTTSKSKRCGNVGQTPVAVSAEKEVKEEGRARTEAHLNRPMTKTEFKKVGKTLVRQLCCKTDSPPVCNVLPGEHTKQESPSLLRQKLRDGSDSFKLIRGYKIVMIMPDDALFTYCGLPMLVLKNTGTGKIVCLTKDDRFQHDPFIFVPSSRMHPDITDDELLSGRFDFSGILGGSEVVIDCIVRSKRHQSIFERTTYATSPESAKAVPKAYIMFYPGFRTFVDVNREHFDSISDLAVSFGMPYRVLSEEDDPDELARHVDKSGTIFMSGTENAHTLIYPKPPWVVEKNVWLPLVPQLHRVLETICEAENSSSPDNDARYTCLSIMYTHLLSQYKQRLNAIPEGMHKEHQAIASSGFY